MTEQGAILIATVYPIGVLILVFELRSTVKWASRRMRSPGLGRFMLGLGLTTVVGAATASTALCVGVVAFGVEPPSAFAVRFIVISGSALYVLVLAGTGLAVAQALLEE